MEEAKGIGKAGDQGRVRTKERAGTVVMNHGARFLVSPVLDMLFTGMIEYV